MVVQQLPKLTTRVRFPSPAPLNLFYPLIKIISQMLTYIPKVLLGVLVLIGCGLWCTQTQQEGWYDLYNYHFYNGWAFATGNGFKNYFVTGIYTFFAPLMDCLTYLEIKNFNNYPRLIFFINGFFQGFIYILVFHILKLFVPTTTKTDKILFLSLLLYSVSGFALVMQLGTSSHEIEVSCLFLFAFYLFFKDLKQKKFSIVNSCGTGLMIGGALGLKLTLLPMCIGFGCCVLFLLIKKQLTHPIKTCLYLAIGSIIGFLLIDGWWLYLTWKETGNPIFPMANHIFKSPLLPPENFRDIRFLPKTLFQALFYPFYWITGKEYVTDMDVPTYILHAIIPYICILFLLCSPFRQKKYRTPEQALITFYVFSYIAWLGLFSILRYTVTLEILSGAIIFLAIQRLSAKKTIGFFILAAAILSVKMYPSWRARSFEQYLPEYQISLTDDTVVIVAEDLSSYLVPFIRTQQPVLGFTALAIGKPIPWDQKTRQLYFKLLKNKKIVVITNTLKTLDLLKYNSKMNIRTHVYQLPNDTPIRYFILAAEKKGGNTFSGFYPSQEHLNEFIDVMTAKTAMERYPKKFNKDSD